MTKKPIFMGSFRSGTTLLANLLAFHPDLAPWFETKGFCEALRWIRVLKHPEKEAFERVLVKSDHAALFSVAAVSDRIKADFQTTAAQMRGDIASGKGRHERYSLGHDCVLYSLDQAYQALDVWQEEASSETVDAITMATGKLIKTLGGLHALAAEKPIWINKTPEIPRFGVELRQSMGPCRMILMIRDGRDVVRSAVRLGWGSPQTIASWWQGMIIESRAAALVDPEDYLEIRYEHLLEAPKTVLGQVLKFMGVSDDAEAILQQSAMSGVALSAAAQESKLQDPSRSRAFDAEELGVDLDFLHSLGYS
ncbi:MAG: sulfotransferase [Methylococcaceae bacterium]